MSDNIKVVEIKINKGVVLMLNTCLESPARTLTEVLYDMKRKGVKKENAEKIYNETQDFINELNNIFD